MKQAAHAFKREGHAHTGVNSPTLRLGCRGSAGAASPLDYMKSAPLVMPTCNPRKYASMRGLAGEVVLGFNAHIPGTSSDRSIATVNLRVH